MYCTSTLHPLPAFSSVAGRQTTALHSEIVPQRPPQRNLEPPNAPQSLLYSSLALFVNGRNCQTLPRHPCKVTPDMSFVPRYVAQTLPSLISTALGLSHAFCISDTSLVLSPSKLSVAATSPYPSITSHSITKLNYAQPPVYPRFTCCQSDFMTQLYQFQMFRLFSHFSTILFCLYPPTPLTPPCVMRRYSAEQTRSICSTSRPEQWPVLSYCSVVVTAKNPLLLTTLETATQRRRPPSC